MSSHICTYSGVCFNPLDPSTAGIRIEDIAHALSNQCRFAGHVRAFYSVAQHSVLVSYLLPPEFQLVGLLHDASEAYLQDMPSPIKAMMPEYRAAESALQAKIYRWADVRPSVLDQAHGALHDADKLMLAREQHDLMPKVDWLTQRDVSHVESVVPWGSVYAKAMFLARWARLTGGRVGQ